MTKVNQVIWWFFYWFRTRLEAPSLDEAVTEEEVVEDTIMEKYEHITLISLIKPFCQTQRVRDASVQIKDDWQVIQELDFNQLEKLLFNVEEPEDL